MKLSELQVRALSLGAPGQAILMKEERLRTLSEDLDVGNDALRAAVGLLNVWLTTTGSYRTYDDKFKKRVEKFIERAWLEVRDRMK